MMDKNSGESGYRAKIILLKYEGYTVPEIKRAINHHDINIRKCIHRFNEKGIEGIISKIYIHKPVRITDDIEKKIIEIATKNPRKEYGLPFSTWSLRGLVGYVSTELNLIDSISQTEIRNIFLRYGIRYRQSKVTLGDSLDPGYHLKKENRRFKIQ